MIHFQTAVSFYDSSTAPAWVTFNSPKGDWILCMLKRWLDAMGMGPQILSRPIWGIIMKFKH